MVEVGVGELIGIVTQSLDAGLVGRCGGGDSCDWCHQGCCRSATNPHLTNFPFLARFDRIQYPQC